ncbi:MAG: response regulator [Myxococcales bacterium]
MPGHPEPARTPEPPQVYVVDDERQISNLVRRLLERAGYRVATFLSPVEFLEQADLTEPTCVLLDMNMPEMTGLDVQQRLKGYEPPPRIVFVSGGASVPHSVQAMKAGAVDFLEKPFQSGTLLSAVADALAQSKRDFAAQQKRTAARERLQKLTPREREVIEAVVRGLRSKQIAEELGAAEKTVNIHRSNAMRKLEVETVARLIALMSEAR